MENNKPDYSLLSMEEISATPHNGRYVVSTFSGCGGSCLGFKMAGFKVLWANEFIRAARDTYRANYPDVILDGSDIRNLTGQDILRAIGREQGDIDVVEGSPPCADFSMAGKRRGGVDTKEMRGWGKLKKYSDTYQQVDDLFYEFARILKDLQPKIFVAENVKGLTLGHAKELLGSPQLGLFGQHEDTIFHTLTQCGYNVRYKVLNAYDYGVPQHRERLFFIGTRMDLPISPVFPLPMAYRYNLKDAIGDMDFFALDDFDLTPAQLKGKTLEIVQQLLPGQSGSDIMGSGSYFSLRRLEWDKPAGTIQQSEAKMASTNQIHPDEDRRLTIAELKRVASFPDDFILTGTYEQKWERIGRAVPPLLMYHIAKVVKELLDKC